MTRWIEDQTDAAAKDAVHFAGQLQEFFNDPMLTEDPGNPVFGMAESAAYRLWFSVPRSERRACLHYGASPQPVYLVGDVPGVLVCRRCLPRLVATILAAEDEGYEGDDLCFMCRKRSELFHEAVVVLGPLTIIGHACPACHATARTPP